MWCGCSSLSKAINIWIQYDDRLFSVAEVFRSFFEGQLVQNDSVAIQENAAFQCTHRNNTLVLLWFEIKSLCCLCNFSCERTQHNYLMLKQKQTIQLPWPSVQNLRTVHLPSEMTRRTAAKKKKKKKKKIRNLEKTNVWHFSLKNDRCPRTAASSDTIKSTNPLKKSPHSLGVHFPHGHAELVQTHHRTLQSNILDMLSVFLCTSWLLISTLPFLSFLILLSILLLLLFL